MKLRIKSANGLPAPTYTTACQPLLGDIRGPVGDIRGPVGDIRGPVRDIRGPAGDIRGPAR